MSALTIDDASVDQLNRTGWWSQGACKGMPSEWFFPTQGQSTAPARAVCSECPVQAQCLADALAQDATHSPGIFGGTSARERRRLQSGDLRLFFGAVR